MDQNSLDNIFKQGLENHKSSLDKDALWVAVNGNLSKEGFSFLKILSVLSVTAVIGFGLYITLSDVSQDSQPESYSNNSYPSDAPPIAKDEPAVIQYINQKANQKNSALNLIETSTVPNLSNAVNEIKVVESKKEVSQEKSAPIIQSTNVTNKPHRFLSYDFSVATSKSKVKATQEKKTVEAASVETISIAPETKSTTPNVPQTNKSIRTKAQKSLVGNASISQNYNAELSVEQSTKQISSLKHLDNIYSISDYNREIPKLSKKQRNQLECYDPTKKKNKISAEIYTSLDFVNTQFAAPPESRDYLIKRDVTQTQLEGYRSGLRLKYTFPSGIYIKGGLEAGLIRERFNEEISEESIEILPNQLLEIKVSGDTTIFIYGDAEVLVETTQTWRVENSYKTLGIPLLVGYQWQNERFRYGIDIGIIQNVIYDFDGYLANVTGTPLDNPDFFRPSINQSLTGGLSISYAFNKRLNLFIQTSFKRNLEEINNVQNEIHQKNTKIGLGLGVEYLIN